MASKIKVMVLHADEVRSQKSEILFEQPDGRKSIIQSCVNGNKSISQW